MSYLNLIEASIPYCAAPLGDGAWIILNRAYKPVGMTTEAWVNYEDHPEHHIQLCSHYEKKLRAIGFNRGGPDYVYFFRAGSGYGALTHDDKFYDRIARLDELICRVRMRDALCERLDLAQEKTPAVE